MSAVVADSDTPSGDYVGGFTTQSGHNDGIQTLESNPSDPPTSDANSGVIVGHGKPGRSPFHRLKRGWFALRWKLAANVFSRPVPFLTANLDLKLGDMLITLPIAAILLAVNANLCAQQDVAGSGSLPTLVMLVVIALTVRNNSILLSLTGLPYERALLYHKFFGVVSILLGGLHGLAYLLEDTGVAAARRSRRLGGPDRGGTGGSGGGAQLETSQSGAILFCLLVALFVLSMAKIRRMFYEAFLRMHILLFLAILAFAAIHGAGLMFLGVIPWAIDLIFRHGYLVQNHVRGGFFKLFCRKSDPEAVAKPGSRLGVIAQHQLSLCRLPGNILRVQFPRVRADTGENFQYEAGQYVFLCLPKLCLLEWHPFTISSSPHEALVTIHIKALGNWTKKLLAAVPESTEGQQKPVPAPFPILVDGPYGSVSVDIDSPTAYSHVALFSGGIGITPMQAIANQLHFDYSHRGRVSLKKVHFVWAVRERAMVEAMAHSDFVDQRRKMPQHSDAYFPDVLLAAGPNGGSTSPTDVFKSEFFLTRGQPDLENPVDRSLQHCLRYNTRPDVAEILRSLGQDAEKNGKRRVAVLVCGPSALVKDVISKALMLERKMKVQFDVHTECFDF
ncbi:hypothetical protein BBJ28_00006317 [Nothophytophthora sp. Chile5]|nr:hypothetical protein BBJ28_00006317 [Nothophytophthora sp. Chile5]